jgi:hypothetical protein
MLPEDAPIFARKPTATPMIKSVIVAPRKTT